jgi:acetylornithine deacetylase
MVKAIGKAAHSGYPWLGESANSMLIPALSILETLALPWSKKYGNTTLNIGRMEGGVANNVIAETATAGIAVRLANGTAEMTKQIILHAIKEVDHRLEVMFLSEGYGPVDVDADVEGSFYILLYQLVQFLSWL